MLGMGEVHQFAVDVSETCVCGVDRSVHPQMWANSCVCNTRGDHVEPRIQIVLYPT